MLIKCGHSLWNWNNDAACRVSTSLISSVETSVQRPLMLTSKELIAAPRAMVHNGRISYVIAHSVWSERAPLIEWYIVLNTFKDSLTKRCQKQQKNNLVIMLSYDLIGELPFTNFKICIAAGEGTPFTRYFSLMYVQLTFTRTYSNSNQDNMIRTDVEWLWKQPRN